MAESCKRRKRIIVWCGVAALTLVLHVASGPFVLYGLRHSGILARYPFLSNVFVVVYSPGVYLYDHPEAPGHNAYVSYCDWSARVLDGIRKGN